MDGPLSNKKGLFYAKFFEFEVKSIHLFLGVASSLSILCTVGRFLLLSVGKFGKFLTPPPLENGDVLNGWSLMQKTTTIPTRAIATGWFRMVQDGYPTNWNLGLQKRELNRNR